MNPATFYLKNRSPIIRYIPQSPVGMDEVHKIDLFIIYREIEFETKGYVKKSFSDENILKEEIRIKDRLRKLHGKARCKSDKQ